MTPGQQAYEADVKRRPRYHDGTPRKTWAQLSDIAHDSWERVPSADKHGYVSVGADGRRYILSLDSKTGATTLVPLE